MTNFDQHLDPPNPPERAQALTTLEKLAAMEHKLAQMYGSELLRPIDTAQGRLF